MKTRTIAVIAAVAAVTTLSCTKIGLEIPRNPEELEFAPAPFTVRIDERRCYKDYTYNIPEDDAPVLTYWNTVTVTASSDDPSFNGVNVSSSDPAVMSVERTGKPGVYSVTYRSDGQAELRVWNSAHEQKVTMTSQHTIELEGILMRVYNDRYSTEFVAKADRTLPSPNVDDGWLTDRNYSKNKEAWVYFNDYDFGTYTDKDSYTIEIVDIVPANASWRMIKRMHGAKFSAVDEDYSEWFVDEFNDFGQFEMTDIKDVSTITGKRLKTYVNSQNLQGKSLTSILFVVSFMTNVMDFSVPAEQVKYSTVVCCKKVSY